MKISGRSIFFLVLAALSIWFLYVQREILTPFVIAAIFAYILNPLISFFNEKLHLPRTLSILVVYLVLIVGITFLGTIGVRRLIAESDELASELTIIFQNAESSIAGFPDFLQEPAKGLLLSLRNIVKLDPSSAFPFFNRAVSQVVSLFTFLLSAFYFLKDGKKIFGKSLLLFPNEYRVDFEIVVRRINQTLGAYLRGEIVIILIMAVLYFIVLSILGVRFALLIAFIGGLLEIIPMIGPIIAGSIAIAVAVFDGASKFNMSVLYEGAIIAFAYFVLNQLESYLIIPTLFGKLIKLHPLIIVLAVLAGGHTFGILGIILAVPIAASLRVVLGFILDKLA